MCLCICKNVKMCHQINPDLSECHCACSHRDSYSVAAICHFNKPCDTHMHAHTMWPHSLIINRGEKKWLQRTSRRTILMDSSAETHLGWRPVPKSRQIQSHITHLYKKVTQWSPLGEQPAVHITWPLKENTILHAAMGTSLQDMSL